MEMGSKKGMQLPKPMFEIIELDDLPNRMQILVQNKIQFLLYVDKKFVKSHCEFFLCALVSFCFNSAVLKLHEKRYGLLTQHLTLEVVGKARAMTLTNVLNKMNMK